MKNIVIKNTVWSLTNLWYGLMGLAIVGLLISAGLFLNNLGDKQAEKNSTYSKCLTENLTNTATLVRECWLNAVDGSDSDDLDDAISACRKETEIMICRR